MVAASPCWTAASPRIWPMRTTPWPPRPLTSTSVLAGTVGPPLRRRLHAGHEAAQPLRELRAAPARVMDDAVGLVLLAHPVGDHPQLVAAQGAHPVVDVARVVQVHEREPAGGDRGLEALHGGRPVVDGVPGEEGRPRLP